MPLAKLKFRTRLVITYLLLAAVPLLSLAMIFYYIGLERMSKMSSAHALDIVQKSNEIADMRFTRVRERGLALVTDETLFRTLAKLNPEDELSIVRADRVLTDLLNRNFREIDELFSAQLATSYYTFGTSPLQGFIYHSDLFSSAVDAGGRLRWVPTYDFADMYRQKELRLISATERYYFSAVMQLRNMLVTNGVAYAHDPSVELPVLVLNYKADYFKGLFESSVPLKGMSYLVLSDQGQVVSHPSLDRLGKTMREPWIEDVLRMKNGTLTVEIDGRKTILCFATSTVTGWTSVVLLPNEELIEGFAPAIRNSVAVVGALLIAVSFALSFVVSGQIARPMRKLLSAIRRTGTGNLDVRVTPDADVEFGVIFKKFNEMNDKIQQLIQENYESKLREKEAEITALNSQLNPHFLYNTLNIMNWIAIENDQKQLSKMLVSLSNMLHYTTHNYKETGGLQEEIDWLNNYLFIMSERFEGKFTTEIEIAGNLYGEPVPRLFLHPIVENAILHGFGSIAEGGRIRITGERVDGKRRFTVEDNGRGMDQGILEKVMDPHSKHVGMKNVHNRIQLIHGPEYGIRIKSTPGQGTRVEVYLP